ncbi:MAG: hypothetical protein ACJAY8_000506, partial [Sphingobacteriales bacterium]
VGMEVPSGKFKIEAGGYVGLMHPDGTPIELSDPGEFDVKGLLAIHGGSDGIGARYLKYVVKDLTDAGDESYLSNMDITGSVERAFFDQFPIVLHAPEKSRLFRQEAHLSWDFESNNVEVQLMNMKEEVLNSWKTKERSMTINTSKFPLEDGQFYIIRIKDNKGNTSKKVFLQVPIDHEVTHNSKALIEDLEAKAQKSPLAKIQLAKWMEENGFILNAYNQLRLVNEEFSGVGSFEKSLAEFKQRHKIF